jgi:hypothetical protein
MCSLEKTLAARFRFTREQNFPAPAELIRRGNAPMPAGGDGEGRGCGGQREVGSGDRDVMEDAGAGVGSEGVHD